MDGIYSITVRMLERLFASRGSDTSLNELNDALRVRDFKSALRAASRISYLAGLESAGRSAFDPLRAEMTFISGVCRFCRGELQAARGDFSMCLKNGFWMAYSYLFLAEIAEREGVLTEAASYAREAAAIYSDYYYFRIRVLRLALLAGDYGLAGGGARAMATEIGELSEGARLLPAAASSAADASSLNGILRDIFSCSGFLYELLYISAESSFNEEMYEASFEYFKEASSAAPDSHAAAECHYKMAACKIRTLEASTALGLLERVVAMTEGDGQLLKYRLAALSDIANVYEFHLGDPASASSALMRYSEYAPEDHEASARLGGMLYELGRFNEALYYLDRSVIPGGQARAEDLMTAARAAFGAGMYERALETAAAAASLPPVSMDPGECAPLRFDAAALAARICVLRDEPERALRFAEEAVPPPGDAARRIEKAELQKFISLFADSFVLAAVSPGEEGYSVRYYRGFVEMARAPWTGAGELAKRFSSRPLIVLLADGARELAREISSAASGAAVLCGGALDFALPEGAAVIARGTPLSAGGRLPESIAGFEAWVCILATMDLDRMPPLSIPGIPAAESGWLDHHMRGVLLAYDLFRSSGRAFGLVTAYCGIERATDGQDATKLPGESMWPLMVNFRNVDVSQITGSDRERCLVYGCDDIFIYNLLRTVRCSENNGPVHIFVEPSRISHYCELISFILGKVDPGVSVERHEDAAGSICLCKVNSLLAGAPPAESDQFLLLVAVMALGAGVTGVSGLGALSTAPGIEKISFAFGDCVYPSCPEAGRCPMARILDGYSGLLQRRVHVSPYSNFFMMSHSSRAPERMPVSSAFVFCDLPSFLMSARAFFSAGFDVSQLAGEASRGSERLAAFLSAIPETAPAGAIRYDDACFFAGVERGLRDCLAHVPEGSLDGSAGLFRLSELLASGRRITGMLRCRASASLIFESDSWQEEVRFTRAVKRVYFVHPGGPDDLYEKGISALLKFFRRFDLSAAYNPASGRCVPLLLLSESADGWKDIASRFLAAGRRVGRFFLAETHGVHDAARDGASGELLARGIRTPSQIEPYLAYLDCVMIDYSFTDLDSARAVLVMIGNMISKYNVDILWVVVSEALCDIVFSGRSGLESLPGLKFFSNEIECCRWFAGGGERSAFLRSLPSLPASDNAFQTPGAGDPFPVFSAAWTAYFQRFWSRHGRQFSSAGRHTVVSESYHACEHFFFEFCHALVAERTRDSVYAYVAGVPLAARVSCVLRSAGACKATDEVRGRVRIVERRDVIALASVRSGPFPRAALAVLASPESVFASAAFRLDEHERLVRLMPFFDAVTCFVAALPPPPPPGADQAVSHFNIFQSAGKPPGGGGHADHALVPVQSTAELWDYLAAESERGGGRSVLLCASSADLRAIFDDMPQKYFRLRDPSRIAGFRFEDGSAAFAGAIGACGVPQAGLTAFVVFRGTEDAGASMFAALGRAFVPAGRFSLRSAVLPSVVSPRRAGSALYQYSTVMDMLLREGGFSRFVTRPSELAALMPVASFSTPAVSRVLAILAAAGRIRISVLQQKVSAPLAVGAELYSNLVGSGAIVPLFGADRSAEAASDLRSAVLSGTVRVDCEDELIDRLAVAGYHEPVSAVPRGSFDEGIRILGKAAVTRRTLLSCLFDIEGFGSGEWVQLPFLESKSITHNDFVYARELAPLSIFSVCEMRQMQNGDPGVRVFGKPGNMEFKTERIAATLAEVFGALHLMETPSGGSGLTLSAIASAVTAGRRKSDAAARGECRPSQVLRALRCLFMYGLADYSAPGLLRHDEQVEVTVPEDYRPFDYRSFLDGYSKVSGRPADSQV